MWQKYEAYCQQFFLLNEAFVEILGVTVHPQIYRGVNKGCFISFTCFICMLFYSVSYSVLHIVSLPNPSHVFVSLNDVYAAVLLCTNTGT
jgi:hypothetical protein